MSLRWKTRTRPKPSTAARTRLYLELLEDRCTPDATGLGCLYEPGTILVGDLSGGVRKIEIPEGIGVAEALAEYQARADVAYAEPDYFVHAAVIPNDTSFGSLYGLNNTGQSGGVVDADIDAPEAWDVTTGSAKVVVGVIDTGVDYQHPDLYLNIWINQEEIPSGVRANLADTDQDGLITFYDLNNPDNQGPGKISDWNGNGRIDGGDLLVDSGWLDGIDQDPYLVGATTVSRIDDLIGWNFVSNNNNPLDDNNHGTHVSGTIGAIGNNALGVTGVNWQVQIAGLKFLNSSGSGTISAATSALDYATANGIKITNNSWGGGGFSSGFSAALTRAQNAGYLFVAAAGNSNNNNDALPSYPASYTHTNIIAVAATDRFDAKASFSSYGANSVDLGAPGVSILSTVRGGGYASFSGTSMATPHVAGAAALVWSTHASLTHTQVISALLSTADPIAALAGRTVTGGRLNVNDAVRSIAPPPPPPSDTTGARVVAAVANGTTSVSSVRLTFNEAIDPNSFDSSDITNIFGPDVISIVGVSPVAGFNTQFDVTFTAVATVGDYGFDVGPHVLDLAGNPMDQDQDGMNGDAEDAYAASFSVIGDTTGARVTTAVANGSTSVTSVRLTFSEAIEAMSFDESDITNPTPGFTITGVNPVLGTNNQFDVMLTTVSTPGTYGFDVGPDVLDLAGNQMDQNGDGANGSVGDTYRVTFAITGTFTFTNSTPAPIRDLTNTVSFITINQDITIADVNVRINITHTWDSDLYIDLRGPDLTTALLIRYRGGSGDNFTNTVLNDEAGTFIGNGAAPFAGSYRPEVALSRFDGKNARGQWRLRVYDAYYFDVGTLHFWSLTIEQGGGGFGLSIPEDGGTGVGDSPKASAVVSNAPPSIGAEGIGLLPSWGVQSTLTVDIDEPAPPALTPIRASVTAVEQDFAATSWINPSDDTMQSDALCAVFADFDLNWGI
ncbi:MAG: S8 family serine peptidase [Gemmataceae bacterium]|nr:S8 family serine peptidase [Gemmataceae bacterium]